MTKRSVINVILFSILSCGIYTIYWFYVTAEELNGEESTQEPLMNYIIEQHFISGHNYQII